jgi:ketosteroid isomerase-like protein
VGAAGLDQYTLKEMTHKLFDIYAFLVRRGEAFEGGFPHDPAKWQPLWELIRMTFYTSGEEWSCQVFARKRVTNTQVEVRERFWAALEAGDIEAVTEVLVEDPTVLNLPRKDEHFPITFVAEKGDKPMLRWLLMNSAVVNAPGE